MKTKKHKNTYLSNSLAECQKEFGYTQEEFANEIGVSRVIYNSWLHGKSIPNLHNARKIHEIFGLEPEVFFYQ